MHKQYNNMDASTHFDDDTVLILLTCDDLQTVKACTVVHRVGIVG